MTANCITCNKEYFTSSIYIKRGVKNCSRKCSAIWRTGRKASDEHKLKSSLAKRGALNPNYKLGKPSCSYCHIELKNYKAKVCWGCLIEKGDLKSLVPRGKNHYKWTNGIYKKSKSNPIRTTSRYKRFRISILQRDKNCIICFSNQNLQLDHIASVAKRPDLVFEETNVRILCKECHKKTPNFGGRNNGK